MPSKEFLIENKLKKRLSSVIQHKLRVTLQCYTIQNFKIIDGSTSFTFNKTHKIKSGRVIMKDPKTLSGRYELKDIDGNIFVLKLMVD